MNAVVIGSGGREHAIAYKIKESPLLEKLYIIPGNPGTESLGENVSLNTADNEEIVRFCQEHKIDLVVVGPEIPLVNGLADTLRKHSIKVFGPDAAAAEIEGNKTFAKRLMQKYNIPTAGFRVFRKNEYAPAVSYLEEISYPIVIKASGLAAGKGVLICQSKSEALEAVEDCFGREIFGSAGGEIVIEEFMTGQEASIFAVTDGENYICLPAAQDHKRIGDGDTGKNTGGMGAYAPAPVVTEAILKETEERIIRPTLEAMRLEGRRFSGCLYCGVMLTSEGVKVVEFNCRFGDPETQAVLPLLKGDFLKLLYSSAAGNLDKQAVDYSGRTAVCVVAASGGYPDSYKKGFEISGLADVPEGTVVFHAGTRRKDDKIVTDGGRVLGITAVVESNDIRAAKEKAYQALKKINFEGLYYRTDISDKALQ